MVCVGMGEKDAPQRTPARLNSPQNAGRASRQARVDKGQALIVLEEMTTETVKAGQLQNPWRRSLYPQTSLL